MDIRACNNIVHVWTCSDSCYALTELINYVSRDGDVTQSADVNCQQPQQSSRDDTLHQCQQHQCQHSVQVCLSVCLITSLNCIMTLGWSVSLILALTRNILSRNFSRWWMITFHPVCIFCLFLPKIVKIKPKIGNFRPKCWNLKYKVFQKICNRTSWKFNTKLGTKMQFSDALWWCHNIFKVADRHHIENSFLALSHTILAD